MWTGIGSPMSLQGFGIINLGVLGPRFDGCTHSTTCLSRSPCKSPSMPRALSGALSCSSSSSSAGKSVLHHGPDVRPRIPESHPSENEFDHVTKFNMSDFTISDSVSAGLGGRADELLFEATVTDPHSTLHNTKVVLRQLTSIQAQRRGKRAIEVLRKLADRRMMYLSYSMQVHGYISSKSDTGSFTLVHGYHGSFSLRHWLQLSDWLPTLEATLALDEESVRRVGDDTVGGPSVTRQLRLIRILMRDLLIGVNYLHSHGLAHTELRLENVHISPVDGHVKVGILGNAADFVQSDQSSGALKSHKERRKMMIAFDMRCVGFMMAKMVLRELMDPSTFSKFKMFLTRGNDPACLRELVFRILNKNSAFGNSGLQILDRNWGAGWNLLSLLLAADPSKRISCLEALKHPFLCGPKWRVEPSMNIIRWGLGSTAVRIIEEYIYRQPQRRRVAYFIELMEMLNPNPRPRNWLEMLPGRWRLLYSTGKQVGLTFRQPSTRVLINDVNLSISRASKMDPTLQFVSDIEFRVLDGKDWPHDKIGTAGKLQVNASFRLMAGRRLYLKEDKDSSYNLAKTSTTQDSVIRKFSDTKWRKALPFNELPASLPVAKLAAGDIEVTVKLDDPLSRNVATATKAIQEVRMQVPPEMFDLSRLVCGTYLDARLLVVRGVNGSALLFTRSFKEI
uniref:Protein kinase domain-containing protein n=2 Tax=Kalanchoe fedtschenkoi TaxID=63787 RepID=A0A7N0U2F4_KALFE